MSAGMATKVQSKTYFPGSMMDLNNGSCSGMWDPYNDDRSQGYESFLMKQTMDGYPGYMKEQMRQTILNQESIFKHQIQELHRVYRRQRDLMTEPAVKEHNSFTMPIEAPKSSHFLSQVSSRVFKGTNTQRIVIDLELPAEVNVDNEGKKLDGNVRILNKKRAYNLADLNEPIQMEETSFAASLVNKNSDHCFTNNGKTKCFDNGYGYGNGIFSHQSNLLQAEPKKALEILSRKRTLFGVELCENSHTSSFDSIQSSSWQINSSNSRLITPSRAGLPCQNGGGILEKSREKHENPENFEKRMPSWLMAAKGKETMVYQMNLDSLQHNSQQFFRKAETTKVKIDLNALDLNTENEILVKENCKNNCITEMRHQIDLNLSFDEEEDSSSTPYIPDAVVKIALMEIDLEAPATIESETDDDKAAAEAIVSISSFEPPAADTLLWWFAEVVVSGDSFGKDSVKLNNNEECILEGMDYFEYMTLNLQETKEEYQCYKAVIMEEKEEDEGLLRKRTTRKGQGKRGRQRKDFQKDVLPGIVSLSRREVTEDLQIFEEAFNGIGVSWQSKRKAGGKNGRGRRRVFVHATSAHTPPPQPPAAAAAVEESVCREVALEEKSLSGWGKRTRRLPRQRCQNGGNHHSLALKC